MKVDRLFAVLVLEGALLAGVGCEEPQEANAPGDEVPSDEGLSGEDTDTDEGLDTGASEVEDPVDDGTDSDCSTDVCEGSGIDCTSNGVLCCWGTDVCCDFCCT